MNNEKPIFSNGVWINKPTKHNLDSSVQQGKAMAAESRRRRIEEMVTGYAQLIHQCRQSSARVRFEIGDPHNDYLSDLAKEALNILSETTDLPPERSSVEAGHDSECDHDSSSPGCRLYLIYDPTK